jgi:hypothetical protein
MLRFSLARVLTVTLTLAFSCCTKDPMSREAAAPAIASSTSASIHSPTRTDGSNPGTIQTASPAASNEPEPNPTTSTSNEPGPPSGPPDDTPAHPASGRKSCGPKVANPYGYAIPWARTDGSCKACESAPVPLPVCDKAMNGHSLTPSVLRSPNGYAIRLRASLGFFPLKCGKKSGRCACNNTCAGSLQLKPANAVWIGGPRNEPTLLLGAPVGNNELLPKEVIDRYLSPEGALVCTGDEASLCCPFELDHKSLKAEVVVTGGFDYVVIDGRQTPLLRIGDICRLPD